VDTSDVQVSQVANDSGTGDDVILDLFYCIESSLKLLRIHVEVPSNLVVIGKAMKILFQLILVLALATRQAEQGRLRESLRVDVTLAHPTLENIKEKWLKDDDVMRVGRRLNRLTQEEAQITVAQNMEAVYGLISNIKVLMDGARSSPSQPTSAVLRLRLFRWQGVLR
jgi:hypothetical protein